MIPTPRALPEAAIAPEPVRSPPHPDPAHFPGPFRWRLSRSCLETSVPESRPARLPARLCRLMAGEPEALFLLAGFLVARLAFAPGRQARALAHASKPVPPHWLRSL